MRVLVAAALVLIAVPAALANGTPRYKVLSEDAGEIHRTVEIRLERRVNEAELRSIAKTVQEREARSFRRTLVNFYLPGMKTGQGAWATATHTKDIAVRIAGLRLDEEEALTAEARVDARSLVGTWLTSTPAAPGRLTIFRERGKLFAEWRLRNGVKTTDEVTERRTPQGRRFDNVPQTSDHFVLTGGGELELRQGEQLVATAERVDLSAPRAPVAQSTPATQAAEPEARAATFVPAKVKQLPGARSAAAVADPDQPQKLAPRGIGAAAAEQTRLEAAGTAPPAAAERPAAEKKAEQPPAEPARKKQAVAPRPRQHQQPGQPTTKQAGTAQDRLIGQMFRKPY